MNYLAMDTSTDRASVALLFNDQLFCEQQDNIRTHASQLLPMIDRVFKKANATLKQLDGLIVGRGPGSFTGLRIAISHIKGLAFAHDLPIFPVSTLQAIAHQASKEAGMEPILSVIDARMNQLYWSFNDNIEQVTDPGDVKITSKQSIILAGVGFEEYLLKLPVNVQQNIIKTVKIYPSADAMISLVINGKCQACTADDLLPVYLRDKVTHG